LRAATDFWNRLLERIASTYFSIAAKRWLWHNWTHLVAALAQSIKNWLNAGLSFIYPEVCQLCQQQRATPDESFVCSACRSQIHLIEPPFCEHCGLPFEGAITTPFECANCRAMDLEFLFARSAVVARDKVLDLIHRYKYHRAFWFEPFLAELLIRAAEPELRQQKWDCLVPVPLHPAKEREREFNQAERLARRLAAATEIPVKTGRLRRVRATRTQTLLSREERLQNMRRAFAPGPYPVTKGERVVLVDDVLTTGATTSACAQVLRSLGAGEVCVWTVARGI
jgi:ComF family protein